MMTDDEVQMSFRGTAAAAFAAMECLMAKLRDIGALDDAQIAAVFDSAMTVIAARGGAGAQAEEVAVLACQQLTAAKGRLYGGTERRATPRRKPH
jgi:hypothetical protein